MFFDLYDPIEFSFEEEEKYLNPVNLNKIFKSLHPNEKESFEY